jgi:hypothetical protein
MGGLRQQVESTRGALEPMLEAIGTGCSNALHALVTGMAQHAAIAHAAACAAASKARQPHSLRRRRRRRPRAGRWRRRWWARRRWRARWRRPAAAIGPVSPKCRRRNAWAALIAGALTPLQVAVRAGGPANRPGQRRRGRRLWARRRRDGGRRHADAVDQHLAQQAHHPAHQVPQQLQLPPAAVACWLPLHQLRAPIGCTASGGGSVRCQLLLVGAAVAGGCCPLLAGGASQVARATNSADADAMVQAAFGGHQAWLCRRHGCGRCRCRQPQA